MPRVLVSLVGIEKLIPRTADLAVMLKLLPNCNNVDCNDPRYRRFWEHYLCYVVRGKVIEWRLQVIKT